MSTEAIRVSGDAFLRDYVTDGVPASGANEPSKTEGRATFRLIADEIDGIAEGQGAGYIRYATWTELAAHSTVGLATGAAANVVGPDAGTHTDPIVGGTVANKGVYRYQTGTPNGWKRLGDLAADDAAEARDEAEAARDVILDMTSASRNLYDLAAAGVEAGKYVDWLTGATAANASYSASDFIPVSASTAYTVSQPNHRAFYTSGQVFISGTNDATTTFTTPALTAYVRHSVNTGTEGTFQFEEGSEATPYVPFGATFDPDVLPNGLGAMAVSDIILPAKVRVLVGSTAPNIEQSNLYFDQFMQGTRVGRQVDIETLVLPADDATAVGRQYDECWRIEPGNTALVGGSVIAGEEAILTFKVRDYAFRTVAYASTSIIPISKAATTAVRLAAIGDSLTETGVYLTKAQDKIGSVTLQGTMHAPTEDAELNREGRGGWGAATYCTTYGLAGGADSPFMFPDGVSGANYRGNTALWKNVVAGTTGYSSWNKIARGWADTGPFLYDANGYPTSPSTGWVVYDPLQAAGSEFQEWSGASWVAMASQPASWSFDYDKYLTRYAAAFAGGDPTHVSILLGANDFQSSITASAFTTFAGYVDVMIASIQAAVPTVKIILCLPVPGASQDAWAIQTGTGLTAEQFRQNMQTASRYMLTEYDGREAEDIYIAPLGAFVDPVYGFDREDEEPNIYVTGETIKRASANSYVHPNITVGHPQMGDALGAVVQATR